MENSHLTAIELSYKMNRSAQAIRIRRAQLKNTTIEILNYQQEYIIANYNTMPVVEMGKYLKLTKSTIYSRIKALTDEGKILVEQKEDEELEEEVIKPLIEINDASHCKIEPMKKIMVVPYSAAPKNALSKIAIQEDFLEVGNEYIITTLTKREKHINKMSKVKLKLIGSYPEHYLFVNDKGIKNTLNKRDYYLHEWMYEEVI